MPVPEVFSCDGPHFDPRWRRFRQALRQHGFSSREAVTRAWGMLSEWLTRWQEHYQAFYDLLVPPEAAAPEDGTHWLLGLGRLTAEDRAAQVPKLRGFCVYGLVAALLAAASVEGPEEPNKQFAFTRAWLLLGKDLEFDFLASSPWPVSSMDLSAAGFAFDRGEAHERAKKAYAGYLGPPWPVQPKFTRRGVAPLSASIFSWHASLSLEIVTSLQEAMPRRCPLLQAFGAYYPAAGLTRLREAVQEGVLSGELAGFYRAWIGSFLDDYGGWAAAGAAAGATARLEETYRAIASRTSVDVHICVTPLWFCYTLLSSQGGVAIETGTTTPLVVYVDDLPDQVPPQEFAHVTQLLQKLTGDVGSVLFVAPSPLVAALTERLVGLRPTVAAWACWYLARAYAWDAPTAGDVLVLRADLWIESTAGRAFFNVLHLFLAESGFPFGLRTMSPLVAGNSGPGHDLLWSAACSKSRAALFIPDDMAKMIFWEAYAIAMPIWTPAVEHLARMIPFFSYYHFSWRHLPPEAAAASTATRFLDEPFGLASAGAEDARTAEERMAAPRRALFWAGLSDFVRYPHVQRFASIPELIAGLLRCDLQAMAQWQHWCRFM